MTGDAGGHLYRDYDPTTGRYIQADPIGLGGGANPYLYAEGNPVRYMDPMGLEKLNLLDPTPGKDFWMWRDANADPDNPAYCVIYAHGNKDFIYPLGKEMNAEDFHKKYQCKNKKLPILLKSCDTGATKNGFAQQLADASEGPVTAPNTFIWYRRSFWNPGVRSTPAFPDKNNRPGRPGVYNRFQPEP